MTAKNFVPGPGGTADFLAASSWAPDGAPVSGDTLIVGSGDLVIDAGDAAAVPVIDAETMIVGAQATFSVAGETLGSSFDIVVGAPDLLLIAGSTLSDDGTVEVAGTLVLAADSTLAGSGTILIGTGGVVVADGSFGPGITLAFTDATGTLEIQGSTAPTFFQATVAGFQKGDVIDLPGAPAGAVKYHTKSHIVTIYEGDNSGTPEVAAFTLANGISLSGPLYLGEDAAGDAQLGVTAVRIWNGGTGDWFDSANWSSPTAATSYPLFADAATIAAGLATITAADFAAHGSLDNETISLEGHGVTLAVDGGMLGQKLLIASSGQDSSAVLAISGTVTSAAFIAAEGLNAELTLAIGGQLINDAGAEIFASNESGLDITAGRLTNDGLIFVNGGATVAAAATLGGTGEVYLNGYAGLTVSGSVGSGQVVYFDGQNSLIVEPGATFQGAIVSFVQGNTIELPGVIANAASFDVATNELTVRSNGPTGPIVGTFDLPGTYGASSFSAVADKNGNTIITDTDPAPVLNMKSLPNDVAIPAGATVGLLTLLAENFGTGDLPSSVAIQSYSAAHLAKNQYSYWDPTNPSVSYWMVDGTAVAPDDLLTVAAANFADVDLVAGNQIVQAATLTVDDAFDSDGDVAGQTGYEISTVPPQMQLPTAGDGTPTAADIVNAASLIASLYTDVPNTEDCWHIAYAVSAAAGAPLPIQSFSTEPTENMAGGFWRIAYAANVTQPAVAAWEPLVEAGDIVRIGWATGGPHSFTITAPMDQNGTIGVLDNGYYNSGYEAIGIHSVDYQTLTDADDITIYRLDPADHYLVTGSGLPGQFVQGSTYANLILPIGAGDTIAAGGANSEIAGTGTVLNGATIVDFHAGDTIDLTDLAADHSTVSYDAGTGLLVAADQAAGQSVTIDLPQGLPGQFALAADGGEAGLDGDTLGTLYASLFDSADAVGSVLEDVPCFVRGTRIATADGVIPVERLQIGDRVRVAGARPGLGRVRWLGHRRIDLRRHRAPALVQPVRVERNAFARGRPNRALLLSPDHGVFTGGVLIPVKHLVNGHSIVQLAMAEVEYWHVELERHDILLAEGLPVESYLDTGNRAAFVNGARHVALHPDFSPLCWEDACAELVEQGPRVVSVKRRLFRRAGIDGAQPVPVLEVLAQGRRLSGETLGDGRLVYAVPAGARALRLVSPPWVPAACCAASLDRRRLGVRLLEIGIDGKSIGLEAAALSRGFHPLEQTREGPCRWTDGDARLRIRGGANRIELRLADGAGRK